MMKAYQKLGLTITAMLAGMTAGAAGNVYLKLDGGLTPDQRAAIQNVEFEAGSGHALLRDGENPVVRTLQLSPAVQSMPAAGGLAGGLYNITIPADVSPFRFLKITTEISYDPALFPHGDFGPMREGGSQTLGCADINDAQDHLSYHCLSITPFPVQDASFAGELRMSIEQLDAAAVAGAMNLPAAVAVWH